MIPDNVLKLFNSLARSAADEGFEIRLEARDYVSKPLLNQSINDNSLVLTIYRPTEDNDEEVENDIN